MAQLLHRQLCDIRIESGVGRTNLTRAHWARDQACETSQGEASDRCEGRHATRSRTSGVRGNRGQVGSHAGENSPQFGTLLLAPTRVPI